MRDTFYKYMPWVFGSALGWMMWNPPTWLESLGPLAYLVNLALAGVLLVSMVGLVIIANLPARLELTPVGEDAIHPELRELAGRFERLGFRSTGTPLRVKIAPSAILFGFVHETEPVYATAFRTETMPAKTSCDFVSILHGDKAGLTTSADPGSAALPAGDSGLRQVFPGESIETMYSRHVEAVAFLRQRGVHCRAVAADMFERDLTLGIKRQREVFTSSPLKATIVTLWRAGTKRIPSIGPLSHQPEAETQIARLLMI